MSEAPVFTVQRLAATAEPQQVCWLAMHQDYSERFVGERLDKKPSESKAGEYVVKYLLEGNRGHYGCLEHPQITFAVGHFPHTVMQQARTHRVGVSFDVQSLRYTGERLNQLGSHLLNQAESLSLEQLDQELTQIFYLPESVRQGKAVTREGAKPIAPAAFSIILEQYRNQAIAYHRLVEECGVPYEDARNVIGYGIRQHFVVSFNARSLMHFLDLRGKHDAQSEIVILANLLMQEFQNWMPAVAHWYEENRWKKARLAP